MKEVEIYSTATIANVSCGFDIMGLALNDPIDDMVLRKSHYPGIHVYNIKGAELPELSNRNVVGVVLENILHHFPNNKYGIEVEIYKNIKPGSGIGSSAASAAGSAIGANLLFGYSFNTIEIVRFAMVGENFSSGNYHADNVTPAIMGGLIIIKSSKPLEILSLPSPKKLWVTIIHPHIEIKTYEARKILKQKIFMIDAIRQWGNVGALVSAIYKEDYRLISRSLNDFIVEPIRSIFITAFQALKIECKIAGSVGGGISGSGPSIFMLSEGKEIANKIANSMRYIYYKMAINFNLFISTINNNGIQLSFIN